MIILYIVSTVYINMYIKTGIIDTYFVYFYISITPTPFHDEILR